MSPDKIIVEILPDGSLKLTTDKVSAANHLNAENFVAEIAKLAGGDTTVKHKHGRKAHSHTHSHGQHTHQ